MKAEVGARAAGSYSCCPPSRSPAGMPPVDGGGSGWRRCSCGLCFVPPVGGPQTMFPRASSAPDSGQALPSARDARGQAVESVIRRRVSLSALSVRLARAVRFAGARHSRTGTRPARPTVPASLGPAVLGPRLVGHAAELVDARKVVGRIVQPDLQVVVGSVFGPGPRS